MSVTNYYTVNSEIIGEKSVGGARIDYLTDALGSVVATVDQSAQVVNTYRYKPYGGQLSKTGAAADPAFRWVGQQGYRQTGKKYSDVYIHSKHYDERAGRWATAGEETRLGAYIYGDANPITGDLFCAFQRGGGQAVIAPPRPPIAPDPVRPKPPIRSPKPIRIPGPGRGGSLPPGQCITICIIVAGVVACYELCTARPGQPTGPCTTLGEMIGKDLYPDPDENDPGEKADPPPDPRMRCLLQCGEDDAERKSAIQESPFMTPACRKRLLEPPRRWLSDCFQACVDGCKPPDYRPGLPSPPNKCYLSWARRHICGLPR
jgi:hypothetical protein